MRDEFKRVSKRPFFLLISLRKNFLLRIESELFLNMEASPISKTFFSLVSETFFCFFGSPPPKGQKSLNYTSSSDNYHR